LKKVTIVTSTEHESLLLDQLGKARLISFKTVPQSEYEGFEESFTEQIDFPAVYKELDAQYKKLTELEPSFVVRPMNPDDEELKEFAREPEKVTKKIVDEVSEMRVVVEEKKLLVESVEEKRDLEIAKLRKALEEKTNQLRTDYRTEKEEAQEKIKQLDQKLYSIKTRAKSLQVLSPDELKTCSAAGVAKTEVIKEIEEFLKSRSKGSFKSHEISDSESLLFFFGIDDDQKLIEFLFLVYEVVDVFEAFQSGDLLLVLDPQRIEKRIQEYNSEVSELEKEYEAAKGIEAGEEKIEAEIAKLNEEYEKSVAAIKEEYSALEEEKKKQYESEVSALKNDWLNRLGEIRYYQEYLKNYSMSAPMLRNEVLSVMQGWVPDDKLKEFERIMEATGKEIGEKPYYKVERWAHPQSAAKYACLPQQRLDINEAQGLALC